MATDRQRLDSEMDTERLALLGRRRQDKDTLLANEPPRALGVGIALVALLLMTGVAVSRAVEYQETVPIRLAIRTDAEAGPLCEAYIQDVTAVRAGQTVLLTLGPREVQARVAEISLVSQHGPYCVKVDLPPGALTETNGLERIRDLEIEGKIVTQRVRLFDRFFGFFRRLSGA